MIRLCIVSVFALWGIIGPLSGQQNDFLFHQLRVQDGLSQATNSFVYKDTRGFVWISSISGLNRFDGDEVKLYFPNSEDPCALRGENIQSNFYEDVSARIWFSTYEAVHCYDWKNDCFSKYTLKTESGQERVGYHIIHIDVSQQLWVIIGQEALYTFDIQDSAFQFIVQLKKQGLRGQVEPDASGIVTKVLIYNTGQSGVEIIEVDGRKRITGHTLKWDHDPYASAVIRSVVYDGDSLLWVLSRNQLMRYHWKTGKEKIISIENAETFAVLNDSVLLLSIQDNGLKKFNKKSNMLDSSFISRKNATAPELLSDLVNYISVDRDQGLWASTTGLGVSYAIPGKKKFSTFLPTVEGETHKEFIPKQFIPISREAIWCFTSNNGVYELTRSEKEWKIMLLSGLNSGLLHTDFIVAIRDRSGFFWVSTWGGLSVYDARRNRMTHVTDDKHIVHSMVQLKDGRILLTTNQNGLFKAEGNVDDGFHLERIIQIPDSIEYVPVWQDDQGRVWLNEDLQKFIVVDPSSFATIGSVEVNGICNYMTESSDHSTIWISSSRGLFEVDARTLSIKSVYDERKGLPSAGFNSMITDKKGTLWLTHPKGIISFDPVSGAHRRYTTEDGLSRFEYTQASCMFEDGEIWFGTIQGISRFYPDHIRPIRIRAIPHITSLLVNDKPPVGKLTCELSGATNITEIRKLTFNYRHNTLSFLVKSLEYSSPKLNKVRYRVEGIDDHEIETHSGSLVRYPNMPHGTYQLVVYAANSDGVYNTMPRKLTIVITPPFYKTWWFITLMILLVISIIAYVIYLRFSKALELHKVRLKLYENLHDDVGSRLTAIVLSAEDLERNEHLSHPKLKNISLIARSIVGNMRRLVWAIDPENDKMNSIVQKINHDNSLMLDEKIDFAIEIDNKLKNIVVPGEIRYQMSSICNEALNNISKYARATKVRVKITREGNHLKLVVEDNGIGFDPREKAKDTLTGSGYGLANMQRRASRVGGTFNIYSQPGEGTRVEFLFPFKG